MKLTKVQANRLHHCRRGSGSVWNRSDQWAHVFITERGEVGVLTGDWDGCRTAHVISANGVAEIDEKLFNRFITEP